MAGMTAWAIQQSMVHTPYFLLCPFVSEGFVRVAYVPGTCPTVSNHGAEKLVVNSVDFIKLSCCNYPGLTGISEFRMNGFQQ